MTREDRGRNLAVRMVDRNSYVVQSETTPSRTYPVKLGKTGWSCECPDHTEKGSVCKHMYAVFTFRKPKPLFVPYVSESLCMRCQNTETISRGRSRYCKTCESYYTPNRIKSRVGLDVITQGMGMVYSGCSLRKTSCLLSQRGTDVTHKSVLKWLTKYNPMVDEYTKTLRPRVGDHWRIDEIYLKIGGIPVYAFHMFDTETRYIIDSMVSEHKGTDDVRPLFQSCIEITGKKPYLLSSDSAWNFGEAWSEVYEQKNPLQEYTMHESKPRDKNPLHNNQMESWNGNTFRLREQAFRGLKKMDSVMLCGIRIYHNFIRPHLALGGDTPAERAGLHVEGVDKLITLIQNAAR